MFLEQEEYEHAKSLLDKEISPSPLLVELAVWAKEQYNVNVIDYICDALPDGTLRMRLVLWNYKEQKLLYKKDGYGYDPVIQQTIAEKFKLMCKKYGLHEVFAEADKILVVCTTLEDELKTRILKLVDSELKSMEGGDIWRVMRREGIVDIFYQTDAQIEEKEADGTSESIRKYCKELVAEYDLYGLWDDSILCHFISYQTFMEKYEGKWMAYWN